MLIPLSVVCSSSNARMSDFTFSSSWMALSWQAVSTAFKRAT